MHEDTEPETAESSSTVSPSQSLIISCFTLGALLGCQLVAFAKLGFVTVIISFPAVMYGVYRVTLDCQAIKAERDTLAALKAERDTLTLKLFAMERQCDDLREGEARTFRELENTRKSGVNHESK